jgi:hypothetical protein
MVAREPLGPARLSCMYMVFAPYLTLSLVHTSLQYTALELLIASIYTNIPLPIKLMF